MPLFIAHRGASAYAPENTLPAFRLARDLGCHGLEFDVQLTNDGIPIVIHDETLDRTTDRKGQVSALTWKEFQSIDAGGWKGKKWRGVKVPRLEEVLIEFRSMLLNIELKNSVNPYPGLEEKVLTLIERHCDVSRVIVSSFNHESLKKIKRLAPCIRTGVLYDTEPADAVGYAAKLGANAAHPYYKFLTKEKIDAFHARGFAVNAWTVDKPADMANLIRMGVDGIITNYPDRLRTVLATIGRG